MTKPFQLLGHRGARGLFPENTVEGFRAAIALGLRAFELDVGVTRDNQVVVHHDLALNPDIARLGERWPAGSLPLLREMNYEDIAEFDVGRICPGTPTAVHFPQQTPIDGAKIPLLAEVLAIDPGIAWTIELKLLPDRPEWSVAPEEMVERVIEVVDSVRAAGRVTLQSFDWRAPRHVRRVRPDIPRAWLTRPETVADPTLWWAIDAPRSPAEAIAAEGGGTWTAHWAGLTKAEIDSAHALGVSVMPWTVNETAVMADLIAMGVDGLITDYPDRYPGADRQDGTNP